MTGYEWYGELVQGTTQHTDDVTETHQYERMESNGKWYTEDDIERFIPGLLEKDTWYARRETRPPITTRQGMINRLSENKPLRYGNDWYQQIRIMPEPITPPQSLLKSCACGHTIPVKMVMTTSTGTSCPDCYDQMSE